MLYSNILQPFYSKLFLYLAPVLAILKFHLCLKLNQNHVLVGSRVPYYLHVVYHVIEWSHELHQIVTGHGRRDGQDTHHGTASDIFS